MVNESIKAYSYRISQASRTDLVVIMYDMAIEYLNDALKSEGEQISSNIRYAKRVIDQLLSALDMKYELSVQLFQIYQFMNRTLVSQMAKKDTSEIPSVIQMLEKLRKSFNEVSKTDQSGPLMGNVQQVYAGYTYSNAGNSNEYTNDQSMNRGFQV